MLPFVKTKIEFLIYWRNINGRMNVVKTLQSGRIPTCTLVAVGELPIVTVRYGMPYCM